MLYIERRENIRDAEKIRKCESFRFGGYISCRCDNDKKRFISTGR